jgi:hypothetical protein
MVSKAIHQFPYIKKKVKCEEKRFKDDDGGKNKINAGRQQEGQKLGAHGSPQGGPCANFCTGMVLLMFCCSCSSLIPSPREREYKYI